MSSDSMSDPLAAAVASFIREELLHDSGRRFDEKADLIETGTIDSMSLLRLVSFLEENWPITVRDEDMVAENFRTVESIQEFVRRRLNPGDR